MIKMKQGNDGRKSEINGEKKRMMSHMLLFAPLPYRVILCFRVEGINTFIHVKLTGWKHEWRKIKTTQMNQGWESDRWRKGIQNSNKAQ